MNVGGLILALDVHFVRTSIILLYGLNDRLWVLLIKSKRFAIAMTFFYSVYLTEKGRGRNRRKSNQLEG